MCSRPPRRRRGHSGSPTTTSCPTGKARGPAPIALRRSTPTHRGLCPGRGRFVGTRTRGRARTGSPQFGTTLPGHSARHRPRKTLAVSSVTNGRARPIRRSPSRSPACGGRSRPIDTTTTPRGSDARLFDACAGSRRAMREHHSHTWGPKPSWIATRACARSVLPSRARTYVEMNSFSYARGAGILIALFRLCCRAACGAVHNTSL